MSRRDFVKTAGVGVGAAALSGLGAPQAEAQGRPPHWDKQADIVVVGAGAAGLPAAIEAAEQGASVILIDANFDIGGHAMVSGGNVALGGGTSRQKKYGIEDSADLLFADLTDWSVVESNGFPDYRYNDKEIIRAFADNSAPTFEWLVAHGVTFVEKAPDNQGAEFDRKLRAAGEPRRSHGVDDDADRKAGGPQRRGDHIVRSWPGAAAGSGGTESQRANSLEAQDGQPRPAGELLPEKFWGSRPRARVRP